MGGKMIFMTETEIKVTAKRPQDEAPLNIASTSEFGWTIESARNYIEEQREGLPKGSVIRVEWVTHIE